jgi:hypothetical protein
MQHKFLAFALAAVFVASSISTSQGQQRSAANQEKIAALKDAFDNGLLTQQEYDAKLRALNAPADATYYGGQVATKTAGIFDPTMGGMLFTSFVIPADWMFQGGMTQGTGCNIANFPFFRASSPDGLTGFKVFPPTEFSWSHNPGMMPRPGSGCLPGDGEIRAADYMKYLINKFQVEFVKDVSRPEKMEELRRRISPFDPERPFRIRTYYVDLANSLVEFNINNIKEEEEIEVSVVCYETTNRFVGTTYGCDVHSGTTWAPEGKLDAAYRMIKSIGKEINNPDWEQAWLQRNSAQWAAIRAQNAANTAAFYSNLNSQIIASGEAFRSQMNSNFQIHEQQMAVSQRGSDMNLAQQQNRWAAQSAHTDDMVDSILNQQKRYDPTTGQIFKTDSGSQYNWVSTDGRQYYPTNDINDNPNGRGNGDWVLTTNVNASSYSH